MARNLLLFGLLATLSQAYETVNIKNESMPRNNAPLNMTLAYDVSQLYGYNGATNKLTHSFVPVACGANMSVYHTDSHVFPDAGSKKTPILTLNHGYPESSYIWRDVTPYISKRVPVIVADRPGYGLSTPCLNGTDELTMASAILDAINVVYGDDVHVVLGGHDRGARSMQRAAVSIDFFPKIKAMGVWIADIVPIVAEYSSFSNPNKSEGYFHWAFLPRGKFATDVIMAYGGGDWVTYINQAGSGINTTAVSIFESGQAFEVYANFFNQLSVTNTSVFDYQSGNTIDYDMQIADQKANRKINMPTHVMYSEYNLVTLSGFDVQKVWSKWVHNSAGLTTKAACCGQGHFIIELAPDQAVEQLNTFLDRLGVNKEG